MRGDFQHESGWDDTPRDVPLHAEPPGPITRLTPWADWWDGTTQIGWTFKTGPETPVFGVRRIDAGAWVKPEPPGTGASGAAVAAKLVPLTKEDSGEIIMVLNNSGACAGGRRAPAPWVRVTTPRRPSTTSRGSIRR